MLSIRRILLVVASFVTVVVAGDRIGAHLMDSAVMSTHFRYAELYRGALPAKVVVLGNSRALHMFHPPAIQDVTKKAAVNIGFNGLPTVLMPALWHDYLEHHSRPEKLVFEVTCVNREDEPGSVARFTTFMGRSDVLSQAIAKHSKREFIASQLSHLYRFNSELTWRSMLFLRSSDRDWIMSGEVSDEQLKRVLKSGPEAILYSSENVSSAKDVLAIANTHGIPVELIVAPFHPQYRETLTELPRWIEWFESELGRPVLDYSRSISESTAFADHVHLNAEGAKLLATLLQRDGVL